MHLESENSIRTDNKYFMLEHPLIFEGTFIVNITFQRRQWRMSQMAAEKVSSDHTSGTLLYTGYI